MQFGVKFTDCRLFKAYCSIHLVSRLLTFGTLSIEIHLRLNLVKQTDILFACNTKPVAIAAAQKLFV